MSSLLVEVVKLLSVQMKALLYLRNRDRGLMLLEECRLVLEFGSVTDEHRPLHHQAFRLTSLDPPASSLAALRSAGRGQAARGPTRRRRCEIADACEPAFRECGLPPCRRR